MTPKRPRGGSSMRHQVGQSGRRTQNSPSENPSGRTIWDMDIVDGNLTTNEEIRRQKLRPMSMW
jgi:hypothetical protein